MHFQCLKLLVGAGADASSKDAEGLTALQLALQASHNNCVQYLKSLSATRSSASEDTSSSSAESDSETETESIKRTPPPAGFSAGLFDL